MAGLRSADDSRPVDLSLVQQRFQARFEAAGYSHPDVAAAVITARGSAALGQEQWAQHLGIAVDEVEKAEAGVVAWGNLPTALLDAAGRDDPPAAEMGAD